MVELIDKWEVVSKLITLQNNYTFFKNEWDAERLCREIAKLEIEIGKTSGIELVRCKDCNYFGGHGMCYCHAADEHGTPIFVREDDFCSYGERKDNE